MVRYLFARVALPVGVAFVCCFFLLDYLVQRQLRNHVKEALLSRDRRTARNLDTEAALVRKTVELVTHSAWLADALAEPGPTAATHIAAKLRQVAPLLAEDLCGVAGSDKRPLLALRRTGSGFEESGVLPVATHNGITVLPEGAFFLASYPVRKADRAVGWLTTGRQWIPQLTQGNGLYLVERDGTVLSAAGTRNTAVARSGIALDPCLDDTVSCERNLMDARICWFARQYQQLGRGYLSMFWTRRKLPPIHSWASPAFW